jgi:hypothetical protein
MSYHELWYVLWNWKKEFTVKEFSSVFSSPDANKVLHDMTQKGLLERSGWGEYKVNSPEQYLVKKMNTSRAYELLNEANMDYSLTGPDAVFFWTRGGYQVDRFFGFYPIHLKVRKDDLRKWEKFLGSRKQRFHVKDQPITETLFGLFYVLYPEKDFRTENVEAFRVDPLKDTAEFCQSKIYSYEPALEMLNEMYGLGLKVEYKETKTNI